MGTFCQNNLNDLKKLINLIFVPEYCQKESWSWSFWELKARNHLIFSWLDWFSIFSFIFSSATKEAIPAEERLSQLLERLESLEYRLNTESRQKTELADEVAQLREENQRLQEESATAAQQLRRFTEWFFQTIEKV